MVPPPVDPATGQDATQTPGASTSDAAAAAAQALAAVSNQTNFTPDQPPATAPAAPVTAAAFPAFTFVPPSAPPAGASLLDLFPMIEGSVLLEIARHEFKPGDLYKLDMRHKERTSRQVLELSSGVVSVREQAPRDYPSFNLLYIPLARTSTGDVNALYHLSSSTTTYLARLAQFSQEYQWAAVVAYHFDFHYKRRHDMLRGDYSGWATINTGLQAEHLIGKDRARGPTSTKAGAASKAAHNDATSPCRNFNKGTCKTTPCAWGRQHKCSGCGATDHGQSACPKTAA
ncbi:hypothetical protein C8Q74DRAFT_1316930 [Fomes fomentarius]|nr:hypothetical protein C8Q74DRAFT_1316930 [Fomes fomentarius]